MRLTVSVSGIEQVRQEFERIAKAPAKAIDQTAVAVEDLIRTAIGVHAKKGALERSLGKVRIHGGWEISHDSRIAPYARFVHDGTKPHVIFPRRASGSPGAPGAGGSGRKMLRWAAGGKFQFARSVKHPGTKPDRWMDRAAAQATLIFRARLEALISKG